MESEPDRAAIRCVHRIGQREVCHMWSLVAKDTREGDVYNRRVEKLEQPRAALGSRVYDMLGQVFDGNSLRNLMIQAIRAGDSPETRAWLFKVVDAHVGDGLRAALAADQPVPTTLTNSDIEEVRREMNRAEAGRLQSHHVEAFFASAFADLGGTHGGHSTAIVDRHDPVVTPYVVCLLEHDVTDGRADAKKRPQGIFRRVQYVRVDPDGATSPITQSPISNLEPPTRDEHDAAQSVLKPWRTAIDAGRNCFWDRGTEMTSQ